MKKKKKHHYDEITKLRERRPPERKFNRNEFHKISVTKKIT